MRESSLFSRWCAAVLWASALLTVTDAEPARALDLPTGFLFWVMHIGAGLTAAVWATRKVTNYGLFSRAPAPQVLLAGGLAGSVLFAPLALGLEAFFPSETIEDDPLWLQKLEASGLAGAIGAEWLQLLPVYLLTWFVINVVPFFSGAGDRETDASGDTPRANTPIATEPPALESSEARAASSPDDAMASNEQGASPSVPEHSNPPHPRDQKSVETLLDRLPLAIGRDIIVVRSDLHYLHIRTTRGRTTLLGSLDEIERGLGDMGLKVHRSFWIAKHHVRRIIRTEQGWQCEMRDGSRAPVSRRRQANVRAALGKDFVVEHE